MPYGEADHAVSPCASDQVIPLISLREEVCRWGPKATPVVSSPHHPGPLLVHEQFREVRHSRCGACGSGLRVHLRLERGRGVAVDHAQRHREGGWLEGDELL